MPYTFIDRLKHGWNAFKNRDPTYYGDYGVGWSSRPDRIRLRPSSEKTIVSSINTRIALDVADTRMIHARLDQNGKFLKGIDSGLNYCLTTEANIDQTGRAFMLDVAASMLDEGVVAIVPVDTILNPKNTMSYDIKTLRVGKVVEWYPRHVRVNLYNDTTGRKQEIVLPKSIVALPENPLSPVMNEPNSTMRRLAYKLSLLDAIDEQTSSGKLDMIIQLPYLVKSELRKKQADERREELERQLSSSKHGIGYIDGTEKVIQLNRPIENNLLNQIEYLTKMLYSQLGLSDGIFDGTASNEVLTSYYSRTVEPVVAAIANEMNRKFLSKTARSQGQSIYYYRDPFKFVPVSQIAEMADTFTRNEIMTSNEIRQIIGMKSSDDPRANELRNKNLNQSQEDQMLDYPMDEEAVNEESSREQN